MRRVSLQTSTPSPSPLTPTVNIFSHLLGALLFFALPLYIFNTEIPPRYTVATVADKLVCSTYFLGVAACFSFSTMQAPHPQLPCNNS